MPSDYSAADVELVRGEFPGISDVAAHRTAALLARVRREEREALKHDAIEYACRYEHHATNCGDRMVLKLTADELRQIWDGAIGAIRERGRKRDG